MIALSSGHVRGLITETMRKDPFIKRANQRQGKEDDEELSLTEQMLRQYLTPMQKGGNGRGQQTLFNLVDLTALLFATRLHRIGYGHVVHDVLAYLCGLSETELTAEFERGNIFLLPVPEIMRLMPLPSEDLRGSICDVEATYHTTRGAIVRYGAQKLKEEKVRGPGRREQLTVPKPPTKARKPAKKK